MVSPHVVLIASTVNYSVDARRCFVEATVRPQSRVSGRLLRRRLRRWSAVLQRVPGRRQSPTASTSGLGGSAVHLPRGQHHRTRATSSIDLLNAQRLPDVGRHATCCCRRASRGATASTTPLPTTRRRTSASRARTSPASHDISVEPDEGLGQPHAQERLLQHQYSNKQQMQGGGAGGPSLNFQQDTVGTQPVRHVVSVSRTPPPAASAPTRRVRKASRVNTSTTTSSGYVQDNWKLNRTAHARLRCALRAPDSRNTTSALPGVEFLHRTNGPASAAPVLVRRRLCQRCLSLHRHQSASDEPADRNEFLGPTTHARDRHHGAEQRQPDERPGPSRPGHSSTRTYLHGRRSASRRASGWPTTSAARQQFVLRGGGGLYFDRPSG